MSGFLTTVLKSVLSVAVLFVLTRLMGKKQLSQLTFFDYVAGISIGSIAASLAVDPSVDYINGVTGLVVYALFPIILSFIAMKSYRAGKLLDGKPTILVENGLIVEKNLKKTRMTINDVLEGCRLKNAFDIAEVEFAILETDGKISVQMKSSSRPLTPGDLNIQTAAGGLCLNLIIDGRILRGHLGMIGKDRKWLQRELEKHHITDVSQVLLGYIDAQNRFVVQKKNTDAPPDTPL